jgi:hypothetical protein
MPHPPRTHALRAEPEPPGAAGADVGTERPSRLRSVLLGLGIGVWVGVAGITIAFSIIAIPLFIVASTEPGSGLNRDLVRTGLFKVALPFGVVSGMVVGVLVGVWYARGGRLPRDRTPLEL